MPDHPPDSWNGSRLAALDGGGYESYFLRANHPARPQGFWIRYTAFVPCGHADAGTGELWAICFDGDAGRMTAVREAWPLAGCRFDSHALGVSIGPATLDANTLTGAARRGGHAIAWSLHLEGGSAPLLLLPERYYAGSFPRAKAVVNRPQAHFDGTVTVDGERWTIDGWQGSQNHNWGTRHTDRYVWGQVAGFDDAPDAFLECATAQVKIGPLWTPPLTFVVLREPTGTIAANGLARAMRAQGRCADFVWRFDTRVAGARLHGTIAAPREAFVGLTYPNPPGGAKTCLNCKIARAELVVERRGAAPRRLTARHRAAFEILTERTDHGVAVIA